MKNIKPPSGAHSWLIIFCLVYSGEMIFSLPFHIARFFRPTVLDVFGLNNAALGDVFAIYGVVAMLAYFPGGIIADYFSAKKLMAASLVATAAGGVYFAQIPGQMGLLFLFAYWGLTSICLFWAAMIKATREWGGSSHQGSAFGILEAGRGLVAATIATIAVWILALFIPDNIDALSHEQRVQAIQSVIYFYTLMTLIAAFFVWVYIPESSQTITHSRIFSGVASMLKQPAVWLQATIVICAYSGYKGLDNYALYAHDVLNMNEIESAQFTTFAAYLRPVAAIVTGFIVDRYIASRIIVVLFFSLLISYLMLAYIEVSMFGLNLIYTNIIITFVAIYGIRGVYFALIEETKISSRHTGTAVGIISVIGFTPDIFFASIAGRILDASPGIEGHQQYFLMLSGFAIVGMLACILLTTYSLRIRENSKP